MGSQLSVLRSLLEQQIDVEETDSSTYPTLDLLNIYINNSIRRIARTMMPRELLNASARTADMTQGQNTAIFPSELIVPDRVYFTDSGSNVRMLRPKTFDQMVQIEGTRFFDSNNSGDPAYYTLRGSSLVFNKYFSRSVTDGIKVFGVDAPTTLSLDTDTTELPVDYDLLIVYMSAALYYLKDDDEENRRKNEYLANREKAELKLSLNTNHHQVFSMDPSVFADSGIDGANPNVFFGPQ